MKFSASTGEVQMSEVVERRARLRSRARALCAVEGRWRRGARRPSRKISRPSSKTAFGGRGRNAVDHPRQRRGDRNPGNVVALRPWPRTNGFGTRGAGPGSRPRSPGNATAASSLAESGLGVGCRAPRRRGGRAQAPARRVRRCRAGRESPPGRRTWSSSSIWPEPSRPTFRCSARALSDGRREPVGHEADQRFPAPARGGRPPSAETPSSSATIRIATRSKPIPALRCASRRRRGLPGRSSPSWPRWVLAPPLARRCGLGESVIIVASALCRRGRRHSSRPRRVPMFGLTPERTCRKHRAVDSGGPGDHGVAVPWTACLPVRPGGPADVGGQWTRRRQPRRR